MKRLLWLLSMLAVLSGCSSARMRGTEAKTVAGSSTSQLKVTADVQSDLSLEPYILVDIYLRNSNPDWLRIKNVEIVSVEGAERFRVIVGADLKTWRKAIVLDSELQIEDAKTPAAREKLKVRKARLAEYSDEDYLYQPSSVPPQLQTKKWLLFQIDKKSSLQSFKFEVTWIDDRKQTFEARIGGGNK